MQKVNALPDMNRADVTPDVQVAVHDIGGNVRYSDADRNPALPDANQETVLPRVQVSTGDPNQQNGRASMIARDQDSGTIPEPGTGYAVPGIPHYGWYDASKGHDN